MLRLSARLVLDFLLLRLLDVKELAETWQLATSWETKSWSWQPASNPVLWMDRGEHEQERPAHLSMSTHTTTELSWPTTSETKGLKKDSVGRKKIKNFLNTSLKIAWNRKRYEFAYLKLSREHLSGVYHRLAASFLWHSSRGPSSGDFPELHFHLRQQLDDPVVHCDQNRVNVWQVFFFCLFYFFLNNKRLNQWTLKDQ